MYNSVVVLRLKNVLVICYLNIYMTKARGVLDPDHTVRYTSELNILHLLIND